MPSDDADLSRLGPPPRVALRVTAVLLLAALAVIGTTPRWQKLWFVLAMALLLGTWWRARVDAGSLRQQWTVAFVPLPATAVRLRRFDFIEIVYQAAVGGWEFVLFGPLAYLWAFFAERLFPGISGSYQLWLNNGSDERRLAWQGYRQEEFEAVLERLQLATGFAVRTR